MNIDAKKGEKVIFTNPDAGYKNDQETAAKHLIVNKEYTVIRTDIDNWHTDVILEEIGEGVMFNSVMFSDVG